MLIQSRLLQKDLKKDELLGWDGGSRRVVSSRGSMLSWDADLLSEEG
jgi:hypothetical protein